MNVQEEDFIPTRGSLSKGVTKCNVVEFEAYKPKAKKSIGVLDEKFDKAENDEINMKKARYEIIKFGMSGMEGRRKEEAKVQLAVKLGAKPRKNKARNYKEILEEKRAEKVKLKSEMDFNQLGKNAIGKSTAKGKSFDRKRKKPKSDLLDIYGTVKSSDHKAASMGKKQR